MGSGVETEMTENKPQTQELVDYALVKAWLVMSPVYLLITLLAGLTLILALRGGPRFSGTWAFAARTTLVSLEG